MDRMRSVDCCFQAVELSGRVNDYYGDTHPAVLLL